MEKQSKGGGKPPLAAAEAAKKKLPSDRVFGANALELSEKEASKLVGGIVEKGIADNFPTPPSSAPRPSVLPFPVARHRAHGPHWTPRAGQSATTYSRADVDEIDEEGNDPTNYDPIAEFANPVIKKNKKGLDLSRWRDFVPSSLASNNQDESACSLKMDAEIRKVTGEAMRISDDKNMDNEVSMTVHRTNDSLSVSKPVAFVGSITGPIHSAVRRLDRFGDLPSEGNANKALRLVDDQRDDVKGNLNTLNGEAVRSNFSSGAQLHRSPYDNVNEGIRNFPPRNTARVREKNPPDSFGQNRLGSGERNMSIESQIDAENCAFLDRLSPEEIAETQAEIKNRINPGLVEMLKKRGLQKLEKQLNPSSGSVADNVLAVGDKLSDKHAIEGERNSSDLESDFAPATARSRQNTEKIPEKGVQNLMSNSRSVWDNWSERVEAVRSLRFLLDGNVIKENLVGQTYTTDCAAERDFLRTEGDPGGAGYTVKEAVSLTRSIVPGQRALALHLLASVLSKALHNICKGQVGCTATFTDEHKQLDCMATFSDDTFVDWDAVWAYALGPEPELVLSLRLALDDNHNSVVLASAKVIQCILSCDINENFCNRLEKMELKTPFTAPVFRSRPDIKHGFLGGGYWKYSAKPSNITPLDIEIMNDQHGGEHTIEDDNIIAGQDVVAGLVRMGILPRFRYLLETDPAPSLEECILSVLIAIARHSPTCANAVWKCERLVQTIVDRFSGKDMVELQPSKIKSVTVLRVLAQSSKSICIEFVKAGFFQIMTWQLYRITYSIDEWVKSGTEICKLASELMAEQLRFWRVCILYGCCISYFSAFFPAISLWLNPPTFDTLIEKDVFQEFASISLEAYLVLEALAKRLPALYSSDDAYHHFQGRCLDNVETWCWSDVSPMVDTALKWIEVVTDATLSEFFHQENGVKRQFKHLNSLLWVLSAILRMLHIVLMKATPEDVLELEVFSNKANRLPDFVAKIGLHIISNSTLSFCDKTGSEHCGVGSFIEKLCYFRHHCDSEVSVASLWCLHGLFWVIVSIDHLIQLIKNRSARICFQGFELSRAGEILENGILKYSLSQWRKVVSELMKRVVSEWHFVHDIEVFGRGGPSPGVGVGWGASCGGFWSSTVTLIQADATLLIDLLKTFQASPALDYPAVEENIFITQNINSALASSLIAGPGDKMIVQKAIDMLLQIRVLKHLNQCIIHFPCCNRGQEPFKWQYTEADLMQFSELLASHFTNRWLSVKKKKKKLKAKDHNSSGDSVVKKLGSSLDTIQENVETFAGTSKDTSTVEWAHQRLPLPSHWLLSPISTIGDGTSSDMPKSLAGVSSVQGPSELIEVVRAGLFLLLGIEAISSKLLEENMSVFRSIPLIWKWHSLSIALLLGMGVLEEERSREVFEALQGLYGQNLNEIRFSGNRAAICKTQTSPGPDKSKFGCLRFQTEIHESYPTFIETLVEQFAAISYGDLIYARQIAIYLHRQVESSVRLATWNALSNARVLELLPPLGDCLSQAEGYLEPVEEDDGILEAYVKAWVSGSLDKAATRGSMTYNIALHHLSSFMFKNYGGERLLLRNKLAKSLLRDYSRKQLHEGMMLDLIQCNYSPAVEMPERNTTQLQMDLLDHRLELLKKACEGNSQLLSVVEKLRSSISKQSSN